MEDVTERVIDGNAQRMQRAMRSPWQKMESCNQNSVAGVGGGMCRNHAMTMLEIESYFLPAFHLKMRKKQEVMPLACDKEN